MKKIVANPDIELAENVLDKKSQVVTHLEVRKGKEVPRHKSDSSVIVVIYKGKVEFIGDNFSEILVPGDIIEMEPGEQHALKGLEDSGLMVVKSDLK